MTYSQEQLNALVNTGFLSPQIRSFDLQPFMMVQLYLKVPELRIQEDLQPLLFRFHGDLDAQLFGGPVTRTLPVDIQGEANLVYRPEDAAIYLDRVQLTMARVDVDIELIQAVILEQFQHHLVRELEKVPVILLSEVPELATFLSRLEYGQTVEILTFNNQVLFEVEGQ